MIFVDSNIPMYLVGADHSNKARSRVLLDEAIDSGERLVTNAEVFQEILHRYAAIERREAIEPCFELLSGLVDEVFPVEWVDLQAAKRILLASSELSARDALHVASMRRFDVERILSFDSGFDGARDVTRLF